MTRDDALEAAQLIRMVDNLRLHRDWLVNEPGPMRLGRHGGPVSVDVVLPASYAGAAVGAALTVALARLEALGVGMPRTEKTAENERAEGC